MQTPQIFGANNACEKSLLPMIGLNQLLMQLISFDAEKTSSYFMGNHVTWLDLNGSSEPWEEEEFEHIKFTIRKF